MNEESTPRNSVELPRERHGRPRGSSTTPLFEAVHADRYQRQGLIREIQRRPGRNLICYVSGSDRMIDREDVVPFVDLLHNLPPGRDMDLLLHTQGGDIDVAEKLMEMMRKHVGSASLRVIVPDMAKSAGTLMVLGADSVVMSDSSELGPIDPQLHLSGTWQSAQHYLDAYREHATKLEADPDNIAARIMLGKLDPVNLKLCEAVMNRSRQVAEDLLQRGMFRETGNWSLAASKLLDTRRWILHSQMISWEDAVDSIGLVVEYQEHSANEWQKYWKLHCLQHLACESYQKLYESEFVSLIIGDEGTI